MADNIRVKFEADASSYRKQINDLIQQNKTLKSNLDRVKSSTDENTTAQEKAAKVADALKDSIRGQEEYIKGLEAQYEKLTKEQGENSAAAMKQEEAINKAKTVLNKMNAELDEAERAADGYGDEIQESAKQTEVFNETAAMMARQQIADVLNRAAEAAAAFGKQALGGIVNTTKDFEAAMSSVKALSGATGAEFDALRQKARDMGASTKYSATEASEALGYMALAGWNTSEMVEGLDGVLNLAAASGMELAEASDLVTDFLSAFGKDAKYASKMADMLAYAQANSNTTTRQLGDAFRNSAANMHTAGQSIETTTALLAGMANQGNKGSEAGTALGAMMRDLTQRMKDGKIMIGDTSVQVMDASGNFRNMVDILADVDAATQGMGSAQKSAALMTTFTARSVKGVNQLLTEGVDSIRGYEKALGSASGTAGEMADTMQDNLEGQLTILKSQLQELAISVGETFVPYIRKAIKIIQNIIDKFNAMPDGMKKLVAVFLSVGTATAVVLPKLISLISTIKSLTSAAKVVKSVNSLTSAMTGAGEAAGGMGSKLGSAFGSIGKYAGIIGAVVAAVGALNYAVTEYQLKDDELYHSANRNAAEFKEMAAAAESATAEMNGFGDRLDAEGAQIDKLTTRLLDLNGKTMLTKSEQAEYKRTVQELTQLLPNFSGEIDETTGKLKDQASATKEAFDEMADSRRAQQSLKLLNELIEKQTSTNLDLELAQAKAKETADKLGISVDELRQKFGKAQTSSLGAAKGFNNIFGSASQKKLLAMTDEVVQVVAALDALEEQSETSAKKIDMLNAEVDAAGDILDETGTDVDEFGASASGMADDVDGASGEVKESFADIYNSAKTNLEGTTGLLDEWATDSDLTMEKVVETLAKNAQAWADWSTNVETLINDSRYITDSNYRDFVDSLVELGPKAAGAVGEMADAVRSGNSDIIREWTKGASSAKDARKQYTDTMATWEATVKTGAAKTNTWIAQIKSGVDNGSLVIGASAKSVKKAMEGAYPDASVGYNRARKATANIAYGSEAELDRVRNTAAMIKSAAEGIKPNAQDMYNAGKNAVQGLINGLEAKRLDAIAKADQIGKGTVTKVKNLYQERSPSKVFEQIGAYAIEGLAIGLSATAPLNKAMANLEKVAIDPVLTFGADGINGKAVSNSLTYGDIVVNVSGAGVQNEELLARRVSDQIFRKVQMQRGAYR